MPEKTKAAVKLNAGQFASEMKIPKPGVYLFYGEENFLKRRELEKIQKKLFSDDSSSIFGHYIFTRDNYTSDALISSILAPAVMTDLKLIVLYCLPFAELRKKDDIEGLESALTAAAQSSDTILIIYTTPETFEPGDPKSPSAIMKLLTKYAVPVEFAHETTSRLVMWVQKHFSANYLIAEPAECSYLIETVGHDMATLSGEIQKLCAYLHANGRKKLDREDINLICPLNKEIGAFEFADAILDSNKEKAFYILGDMKQKNEPVPVILAGIIKIYTDLIALKLCSDAGILPEEAAKRLGIHPYVAKLRMAKAKLCDRRAIEGIIDLCAETDEVLKSSQSDEYILLERLIIQASQYRKRKIFN
jgi:DNA polymerase-3 subunit delta